LPPHMEYQADTNASGTVTRQYVFAWQTNNILGSYYSTNQWYQLATTVSPGGRSEWTNYPIDWQYLIGFDTLIYQTLGTDAASQLQAQMHLAREIQDYIKMGQYADSEYALYDPGQPNLQQNAGYHSRAMALRHMNVSNFTD